MENMLEKNDAKDKESGEGTSFFNSSLVELVKLPSAPLYWAFVGSV